MIRLSRFRARLLCWDLPAGPLVDFNAQFLVSELVVIAAVAEWINGMVIE